MILDDLKTAALHNVAADRAIVSAEVMKARALSLPTQRDFPFQKAIAQPGMSFICEVKKASPSKGVIAEEFPYRSIAAAYEAAGAAAVSVLTEREYFQGSTTHLWEIAAAVSIPVLRKDVIVDAYQIYEAKACGASAILLICAVLCDDELQPFHELATALGLSVLVEAHDEAEIDRALACGATIIGVNNRNLRDFSVSLDTSLILRKRVPPSVLFVAESGIKTRADVQRLEAAGADAVLIGETLMRSWDKKRDLAMLAGREGV